MTDQWNEAELLESYGEAEAAKAEADFDAVMEQMCSDCQRDKDECCNCVDFDHYISPDLPNPLEDR